MENLPTEITQYGPIAIIFLLFIREFFAYLKSKSGNRNGKQQSIDIALIEQRLKTIETNHLPHIEGELKDNAKDHLDMKTKLVNIDTKLEELLKR